MSLFLGSEVFSNDVIVSDGEKDDEDTEERGDGTDDHTPPLRVEAQDAHDGLTGCQEGIMQYGNREKSFRVENVGKSLMYNFLHDA